MNHKFTKIIILILAIFGYTALVGQPIALESNQTVHAAINPAQSAKDGIDSIVETDKNMEVDSILKRVTNTMFYLAGIITVIMVIYGGIRFATSAGDPGKAAEAKKTIAYAITGLVIVILAYAIVNFVLDVFDSGPTSTIETGQQR